MTSRERFLKAMCGGVPDRNSPKLKCRRPAGAENYILLFIIPTLTHGASAFAKMLRRDRTTCRPLRG
ncbi:MAG: hypothetical protein WAX69_21255, partial [Victivallales bacterium]